MRIHIFVSSDRIWPTQVHCRRRAWFNACGNHNGRQRYFCSPFFSREDYLWWTHPSARSFFYRLQIPPCVRGCRDGRNFFIGVREILLHQKYPRQISLESVFQSRLFYLLSNQSFFDAFPQQIFFGVPTIQFMSNIANHTNN